MLSTVRYSHFEVSGIKPKTLNWYLCILIALTPFTRVIFTSQFAGVEIDWLAYPLYTILFVKAFFSRMHKKTLLFSLIFILINVFTAFVLRNPIAPVLKTGIPLFLGIVGIVSFLRIEYLKHILKWYVSFAVFAAYFGFIQFFFKFLGIRLLSNFTAVDLHSVAGEPSHYVVIIIPAIVIAFFFFKESKITFYTLSLSLLLTFKLTGILVAFIVLLIIYKKKLWTLLLLFPLFAYIYSNFLLKNEDFSYRILTIVNYIRDKDLPPIFHGTPLSFLSNFLVAMDSLKENWFTGVSIGNHENQYYKTFNKNNFIGVERQFGLNAKSAHSLTIRVLSELGFLGFFTYAYILIKNLFLDSKKYYFSSVVGLAAASHFIGKSIKLGSYIDYGSVMFLSILVYNIFLISKLRVK